MAQPRRSRSSGVVSLILVPSVLRCLISLKKIRSLFSGGARQTATVLETLSSKCERGCFLFPLFTTFLIASAASLLLRLFPISST